MSRLWIIAYDVADDKRRRMIANCLGDVGERVQESVFEAWLSAGEVRRLSAALMDLMEKSEDTVRFYPLAGDERRDVMGAMGHAVPMPSYWMV